MSEPDRTVPRPGYLDPRDVLPPAEAERLLDALARIVLAAARVRAERDRAREEAS